jgi:hypothetical protein
METISAVELNSLLQDPALFPSNIRAASRSIHIAEYPGGEHLRKHYVEESGIYWMIFWPARSMNTYGIVKTRTKLWTPVDNIHYMRFLRLAPVRSSAQVCATNDRDGVTELTFSLEEGYLHFFDQDSVELKRQLVDISLVHADLVRRQLTFS